MTGGLKGPGLWVLTSPCHGRGWTYVHPSKPVCLESLWTDGHNSGIIKLMSSKQSHQLHLLWQLQDWCLDNSNYLNIFWINRWIYLFRQIVPPSGRQIVPEPQIMVEADRTADREQLSSTIWGPGRILRPTSRDLSEVVFATFTSRWRHHRWKVLRPYLERGVFWWG